MQVRPPLQSVAGQPRGTTLHLQVDDADQWFDRAVAGGARAAMPPADMFWGDRYAQVVDPFRFRSAIGSPVKGQPSSAAGTA